MADNEGGQAITNESGTNTGSAGESSESQGTTKIEQQGSGNGSFTQAQLDAIVRDRLARERDKYKGFDDIKRKADEYDKVSESNKTELEKAQGKAEEATTKATQAEAKMRRALGGAAIISEGSKQGARDPSLLVRLIDVDSLEISDDGEVKGAAEAVTALLASHYYLKGGGYTASGDGGQRTSAGLPTFTRDQIADPIFYREHKDEIELAARQGRITTE